MRSGEKKKKNTSAIKLHLLSNPVCRESYDDSWFSVVRSASTCSFKQLKVLEAVYIRIFPYLLQVNCWNYRGTAAFQVAL